MKKWILMLATFVPVTVFAQEAAVTQGPTFWDDPFNHPMLPIYLLVALVFVILLLIVMVAVKIIRVLNLFVRKAAEEKAKREGRIYVPELGWSERFWQRFNDSVPLTEEKTIELEHNYDGIRELDNHLPPWWKWLFYATIAWSVVYFMMYHVTNSLPLSTEEYEEQVASAEEAKQKLLASQPMAAIDENALEFTNDAALIESGKKVFMINCQSCHRKDGGGNAIGPNLTDAYWLHGGGVKQIFGTIKTGVVEKGMPAWGKVMSPANVRDLTFYIMSIQGTNPKDPKAPQGQLEKPTEPKAQSDTVKVATIQH